MIQIDYLTEEVLDERLSSLPGSLQQLLSNDDKLKTVEGVCRSNSVVDEEKILIIQ